MKEQLEDWDQLSSVIVTTRLPEDSSSQGRGGFYTLRRSTDGSCHQVLLPAEPSSGAPALVMVVALATRRPLQLSCHGRGSPTCSRGPVPGAGAPASPPRLQVMGGNLWHVPVTHRCLHYLG